jgi:hypothetical protein
MAVQVTGANMILTGSVEIELNVDNCSFGITLTGFEYRDVWYDQDIIDWVQVKLEEYKL